MTEAEYRKAVYARAEAVSLNRSRRLRGLELVPVPPKPEKPLLPFAYEPDGTYGGRLDSPEDLPEGYILKWRRANW